MAEDTHALDTPPDGASPDWTIDQHWDRYTPEEHATWDTLFAARVMRTEYRIDDFQQNYFVIPSFDDLLRVTVETDLAPLYEQLKRQPDIPVTEPVDGDEVLTRGTQDDALSKAG